MLTWLRTFDLQNLPTRRIQAFWIVLTLGFAAGCLLLISRGSLELWVLPLGLLWLGALFVLQLHEHGVYYSLVLVLVSITIHRERFAIPFELDGPTVLLLGATFLLADPRKLLDVRKYPLLVPIAGFLAAAFAATFVNADSLSQLTRGNASLFANSLRQAFILTFRAGTFVLVVLAVKRHHDLRQIAPKVLMAVLLVQTLLSLAALSIHSSYPTEAFVREGQFGRNSLAIMGFFLEPNLFGIFALCMVGLVMSIYLYSRGNQSRWLLLLLSLGIGTILLSYTRSTWLGLAIITLLTAVLIRTRSPVRPSNSFKGLLLVMVATVAVFLAGVFFLRSTGSEPARALTNRIPEVSDIGRGSVAGRVGYWLDGLGEWRESPWLGTGLLSYEPERYWTTRGWLYSSIMQSLHDTGIVGLTFMLWIVFACMLITLSAFRSARSGLDRGILLGYFLAQISLFFTSQFTSYFWGGLTWVVLGLAVGHAEVIRSSISSQAGSAPDEFPSRSVSTSSGA